MTKMKFNVYPSKVEFELEDHIGKQSLGDWAVDTELEFTFMNGFHDLRKRWERVKELEEELGFEHEKVEEMYDDWWHSMKLFIEDYSIMFLKELFND